MALCCALIAALAPGLLRLEADFSHRGFFWADDPKLKRFEAFERAFGEDDTVVLAVYSPSGVFDIETATLLRELSASIWEIPEVVRVDSLANFNWVQAHGDELSVEPFLPEELSAALLEQRRRVAISQELLTNYLVSRDGTVAIIMAHLRPGREGPSDGAAITQALRRIAATHQRGDHRFYITGAPIVTYAFQEISRNDLLRLLPIAATLAALFLLGLLRSLVGVVLPFAVVAAAMVTAFGLAGWLGLTQTAMSTPIPSILVAVGIVNTVHILITFFTALRGAATSREAAHQALSKNLLPTFLTTITTAIGFFCFAGAELKPIGTLGIIAGIGTLATWIFAQLLVGALLFLLPLRSAGRRGVRPSPAPAQTRRLVGIILRNRRRIIAGTTCVSAALFIYSLGLEVNSDLVGYFHPDAPVRVASEFIDRTVGAARSFEVVVDAGQPEGVKDPTFVGKVDAFEHWLAAQPGVSRTLSVIDILSHVHRALHDGPKAEQRLPGDRDTLGLELFLYTTGLPRGMDLHDRITQDGRALRITVLNTIATSREAVAMAARIEEEGRRRGLAVQVTGKYFLYQQVNEYMVPAFLKSLWSATLLVGVVMVVFLRSLRLGIISLIPNVVPVFAGGALLRAIGKPIDMGTMLVASTCLGISIDDTSHVLANYARLRRLGRSPNEAVSEVLTGIGPSLLSTNAILIASFASFMAATFMPNVYFGGLTAFILSVALLADLFFTPALLANSDAQTGGE